MRRRTMASPATTVDSNLGDVILYDKKSNKLVSTSNFTALNESRYIPIGIVVIPTAHDVYGTGECGVMALLSASTTKPDTGDTSNITMYWGGYRGLVPGGGSAGTNYPELNDFNKFVRYGTMNNAQPLDFIDGESNFGYMPLQYAAMSVKLQCPHDPEANYYNSTSSSYGYLPSPYLADGSRNPDYYKTDSPATTANALSDFAGKANTEILCSKATSQDWRTAQTIMNSGESGYHPAACACWRFHTTGTTQGDWYLPACGELGYIAPRYELIISTIEAIQNWSSSPCCSVGAQRYWSSSEYNANYACSVSFSDGLVRNTDRNFNAKPNRCTACVRPFMRGRFFGIVS